MYTIINRTKDTVEYYTGHWPDEYLNKLLDQGDEVIVMSSYSHTIKIPHKCDPCDEYDEKWGWTDYHYKYT